MYLAIINMEMRGMLRTDYARTTVHDVPRHGRPILAVDFGNGLCPNNGARCTTAQKSGNRYDSLCKIAREAVSPGTPWLQETGLQVKAGVWLESGEETYR
jgi:hypothetical protein